MLIVKKGLKENVEEGYNVPISGATPGWGWGHRDAPPCQIVRNVSRQLGGNSYQLRSLGFCRLLFDNFRIIVLYIYIRKHVHPQSRSLFPTHRPLLYPALLSTSNQHPPTSHTKPCFIRVNIKWLLQPEVLVYESKVLIMTFQNTHCIPTIHLLSSCVHRHSNSPIPILFRSFYFLTSFT